MRAIAAPLETLVRQPLGALGVVTLGLACGLGAALGGALGLDAGQPGWARGLGLGVSVLALIVARASAWRVYAGGGGLGAALPRLGGGEARLAWAGLLGLVFIAGPPTVFYLLGGAWGAATNVPQLALGAGVFGALFGAILGVRLSLGGAASVARGRLAYFRSWALTVGVFWSLACLLLVMLAGLGAAAAAGLGVAALGDIAPALQASVSAVSLEAALAQPGLVLATAIGVSLINHLTAAPLGFAYRSLHAERHGPPDAVGRGSLEAELSAHADSSSGAPAAADAT